MCYCKICDREFFNEKGEEPYYMQDEDYEEYLFQKPPYL